MFPCFLVDAFKCRICLIGILVVLTGGVTEALCPYKCISDRYHLPHCYTSLEELIYTFGGPLVFSLLFIAVLILLAMVLSVARMKFIGEDEVSGSGPTQEGSLTEHSFPFLESLNEVSFVNLEHLVNKLYYEC